MIGLLPYCERPYLAGLCHWRAGRRLTRGGGARAVAAIQGRSEARIPEHVFWITSRGRAGGFDLAVLRLSTLAAREFAVDAGHLSVVRRPGDGSM